MAQLSQMTRYVTNWLGWLPAATVTLDSCVFSKSAKNQDADNSLLQESSGFFTVMAIYLAMTIILAAVSFITARGKANKEPNRLKNKRKLANQQQQQQQRPPWRYSSTGMALTKLIRQLGNPKRSRHQLRLRLRMRLRRHLEQELKMVRELEQSRPQEEERVHAVAVTSSTYFDPSSDAEP